MTPLSRRSLITGLAGSIICAPAIVRASSLMAVKPYNGIWPGPSNLTSSIRLFRLQIKFPETIPGHLSSRWVKFDPSKDVAAENDLIITAGHRVFHSPKNGGLIEVQRA
jgi:hypothetical protein